MEICLPCSLPKHRNLICWLSPTTVTLLGLKSPLPAGSTLAEFDALESTTILKASLFSTLFFILLILYDP